MSWTDERIDTLKKMWDSGLTATQIAEELGGVSRNAVIGKAHRLGLPSRPSPVKPNEAKAESAPKPAPTPAAAAPAAAAPPFSGFRSPGAPAEQQTTPALGPPTPPNTPPLRAPNPTPPGPP
ncbi:GcrA family cell cycle regulator, partial [Sphingomonas sp. dw_22]|uniref:GcrA family cell cycle regulator n=1 Tax=Sphingomonas sp. dw_22 TaxID=2721175 RepID=UPI001C4A6AC7